MYKNNQSEISTSPKIEQMRHIIIFLLFPYGLLSFSQSKTVYVDNGIRLSHNEQKMVSGANIVPLNSKGLCLITYLADNSSSEEIYGKSDDVYVAVQKVHLNKLRADKYIIVARRGMKIGNKLITSIPYNPFIGDNSDKKLVIFEGSIDNQSRGLLYRNLCIEKNQIVLDSDISYLKIKYGNNFYNLNIDTYVMILKDKGYVTSKPGCFVIGLNPRKDKSRTWHMAIGCAPDNYILVLKSKDMYNWEYESILPIKGNETDVYYQDDERYYITRSMNKIYIGESNSKPRVIEKSVASRPRIFDLLGDIYIMYNIVDNDYSTERSTAVISKYHKDGNYKEILKLQRAETIHYYDMIPYNEKVYIVFSTDANNKLNKIKGELQMIRIPCGKITKSFY